MIDYHDYIGKKIKIKDKDGDITEGLLISYEVGEMEDKDFDSIGIEQVGKGYIIDIPIPDIKEFKVID